MIVGSSMYIPLKIIISGRRYKLGDGEGVQIPCKLELVGHRKFIDLLQDELIKLKEFENKKL